MTGTADLEQNYRRCLRWYPKSFRREHETEMLGVLMAAARPGQCRPAPAECLDLVQSGLCLRLRPPAARTRVRRDHQAPPPCRDGHQPR